MAQHLSPPALAVLAALALGGCAGSTERPIVEVAATGGPPRERPALAAPAWLEMPCPTPPEMLSITFASRDGAEQLTFWRRPHVKVERAVDELAPDTANRKVEPGMMGPLPARFVTTIDSRARPTRIAIAAERGGWAVGIQVTSVSAPGATFEHAARRFHDGGRDLAQPGEPPAIHVAGYVLAVPPTMGLAYADLRAEGESLRAIWEDRACAEMVLLLGAVEKSRTFGQREVLVIRNGEARWANMPAEVRLNSLTVVDDRCLVVEHACMEDKCALDRTAAADGVIALVDRAAP